MGKWGNPATFSPVYGLLELTPGKYLTLKADSEWSTYDNELTSHNISTTLWDHRGDRLFVEHRYTQESLESIYTKLLVTMTDRLAATAEYEKDLYEDRDLLTRIGVHYQAQCWSFQLTFTRDVDEERYDVMFGFRGLGEIESAF